MLSIPEWGGAFRVWNEIEALRIEVGEGIEQLRRGSRSSYSGVSVLLVRREGCLESGMK